MAAPERVVARPASRDDRDLASVQEARTLARRAKEAAPVLAELSQEQIDAIVDAMAAAVTPQAEALARLAHEETGYGVVADKVQKNLFASEKVYRFIKPIKTVGVIRRIEDRKVIEIAEPFGVVCAIVPSTNPTSTAIYKILISLKARCPIVISPHPAAVRCITRVAEIMNEAARKAGAPDGAINWMTTVTLEGTQELMKARETAVILATGGMGLVRAAYSAGKPAYGVGPGQRPRLHRAQRRRRQSGPRHRHRQDLRQRRALLVRELGGRRCPAGRGGEAGRSWPTAGTSCRPPKSTRSARILVSPQRLPNPALVGRPADLHRAAGRDHRARRHPRADRGAGRRRTRLPALDREALPGPLVLCRQRLARGLRALQADSAIRRDGPHDVDPQPQRRHHSAVRPQETRLPHRRQFADDAWVDWADDRAGSGDDAGMRRLRRKHHVGQHLAAAPAEHQACWPTRSRRRSSAGRRAPAAARRPRFRRRRPSRPRTGLAAESLARRIDQFLASRGYTPPG